MKSSYRELLVWQRAMDLVDEVYRITRGFRRNETYGLSVQMRRSAVSIASNIAEGQGRHSYRDFRHFLRGARGSALELETQNEVARRQNYLADEYAGSIEAQIGHVIRLLNGMIAYLDRQLRTANRKPRTKD